MNPADRFRADALIALNRITRVMYEGSVDPAMVAKRRASNKRAKAARKAQRRSR
jgi:hypothetical protein